jgi:hypothetical protein
MSASSHAGPFRIDARHPRAAFFVRIATGIWLLTLTGIVFHRGRDRWWSALLVPSAALHFYLAYRLRTSARD